MRNHAVFLCQLEWMPKSTALIEDVPEPVKYSQGDPGAYYLMINTTDWNIKELVPAVAELASCWFRRT